MNYLPGPFFAGFLVAPDFFAALAGAFAAVLTALEGAGFFAATFFVGTVFWPAALIGTGLAVTAPGFLAGAPFCVPAEALIEEGGFFCVASGGAGADGFSAVAGADAGTGAVWGAGTPFGLRPRFPVA